VQRCGANQKRTGTGVSVVAELTFRCNQNQTKNCKLLCSVFTMTRLSFFPRSVSGTANNKKNIPITKTSLMLFPPVVVKVCFHISLLTWRRIIAAWHPTLASTTITAEATVNAAKSPVPLKPRCSSIPDNRAVANFVMLNSALPPISYDALVT